MPHAVCIACKFQTQSLEVIDGLFQSVSQADLWFPLQQIARQRNIGAAPGRIVARNGKELNG